MADKHWYIRARGKVSGPFGLAQLKSLRDRGQLARFHEVSQDRQTWTAASTLTELFPETITVVAEDSAAPGPAMMANWLYMDGSGKQQGPVSKQELLSLVRDGIVDDATLVWKEGMENWEELAGTGLLSNRGAERQGTVPFGFCPDCGKRVSTRAAQCPYCGCPVEREVPRQRSRHAGASSQATWSTACTGILLSIIGVCISTGSFAVTYGLALLLVGADAVHAQAAFVLLGLGGITAIVGVVLVLVGEGMCCTVPEVSRARGLAIATIIVHSMGIFFAMLAMLIDPILMLAGSLVCLASHIVFVFFLSVVNTHWKNQLVARSATHYLIFLGCFLGAVLVFWLILSLTIHSAFLPLVPAQGAAEFARAERAAKAAVALMVIWFVILAVGSVVSFVWFVSLMLRTRRAIVQSWS